MVKYIWFNLRKGESAIVIVYAKNLRKSYGDVQAVRGIDFSIESAECFGFLGPNGAGKTTTIQMIHCFLPITAGDLMVFGYDVRRQPREIKARLGLVPQEDNLDPELSVLDNLLVYASYYGLKGREVKKRAEEYLDFFGLSEKRFVRVDQLSGGMKRRLAIVRGLINDPALLVLDEPTTGLDPEARHIIWQKLRRIKEEGVTLILTTHYMEEAAQLCDRLVIMDHGKIVAEGTPRELVERTVGPHVLEVETNTSPGTEDLLGHLVGLCPDFLKVGDMVFFYPKGRAQELLAVAGRLPVHRRVFREANLEDVFLKLTGRGLSS